MSQLSAQFTEDIYADKEYLCERLTCGRTIHVGEKRLYIGNEVPGRKGRHLCEPCYNHYEVQPTTRRIRTTPQASSQPTGASSVVDYQAIRANVNQSQRQGVHHAPPGHVVGMSLPGSGSGRLVSASAPRTLALSAPSVTPAATGYSAAHLQYHSERKAWAGIASRGPTIAAVIGSGQMPVSFVACYENTVSTRGDKEGFKYILHIRESDTVDIGILPGAIIALAKDLLCGPLKRHSKGYNWDLKRTIVRERKSWQDVSRRDPNIPYFHGRSEFFTSKPGTTKGASKVEGTFKPPKSAIDFVIVIDSEHWEEQENWIDALEESALSCTSRSSASNNNHRNLRSSVSRSDSDDGIMPPPPSLPARFQYTAPVDQESTNKQGKRKLPPSPTKARTQKVTKTTNSTATLSMTVVQNGLLRGGQVSTSMSQVNERTHENIVFYPIQNIPLVDLLQDTSIEPVKIDITVARLGSISYIPARDSDSFLGMGTFKTAHRANLVLHQPVESGLGSCIPRDGFSTVVLKRPYELKSNNTAIRRYGLMEEGGTVISEANVLGWAKSLLEFSYQLIDSRIDAVGEPPLPLPRLRFVDGAVVFVQKDIGSGKSGGISNRAAYLLEELISGSFVKYIHNRTAAPSILHREDSEAFETAVFLCFIQHLQYSSTFGQVFTSDFQGASTLLTDPQIMTNPAIIAADVSLFGEGNDAKAFRRFPNQHTCNRFCKWMGLKQLEPVEVSDSEDEGYSPGRSNDGQLRRGRSKATASGKGKERAIEL